LLCEAKWGREKLYMHRKVLLNSEEFYVVPEDKNQGQLM
jgi:hypothetical protein